MGGDEGKKTVPVQGKVIFHGQKLQAAPLPGKWSCRGGEQHIRSLVEQSPDLFFRIDCHGCVQYLSPALAAVLGICSEAILGQQYTLLFEVKDQARMQTIFRSLLDGLWDLRCAMQLRHRSGVPLSVELQASPWIEKDYLIGIQGVMRPLSRRQELEGPLRASNKLLNRLVSRQNEELLSNTQLLRDLLNTTSAGIGLIRKGKLRYFNEKLTHITGYSESELLELEWSALFAEQGAFSLPESVQAGTLGGGGTLESATWRRRDGRLIDVLFNLTPLDVGTLHRFGEFSLTVRDITAEKRAEQQRIAAYNELEQVFNMAAPLCLLSLECRILKVNQAFCQFFDQQAEALVGRECKELWGENFCDKEQCSLEKLRNGQKHVYREIDRDVAGRRLACALHAAPFFSAEGVLDGMVITLIDTRREKRISADLKKTQEQLIQAEKLSAIGSLAASIAHEFNNPLCGIRSVVDRISRKNNLNSVDQGLLALALEQCDRMKRLIQSLQQFNMPCANIRNTFALHAAIDTVLLLLNKYLKTKKAMIVKRYASAPLLLTAVENQIKQVLLNLIRNSSEALGPGGGKIIIETFKQDDLIMLIITDTGMGISEEHLSHVFEPFFTTKSSVRENGLGLSVTYGIVKSHGGDIQVRSQLGTGTVFTVSLPVEEERGKV